MIIVAGTMTIDPAATADFTEALLTLGPQVRAEHGCSHYSLLVEDAAAGLVNVTEMWRDDAALRVHLTQPWIAKFLEQFGGAVREMAVQIYDVAGVRPMSL